MIVDIPQANEVPRIMAAVKQLHPGDFNFLVNTHAHGDHTAGNAMLSEQMPIIAHKNVRNWLQKERRINIGIQTIIKAQPADALPRLVFEDQLTLHLNQEEIRLIHYPHAHSDSDIIVWFLQANVAHLGDLFWPEIFPFVDVENGGAIDGLIAGIKQVLDLLPEDIQLIPGHGPMGNMKDLHNYLDMLEETTFYIRGQWKAGKTKEEIIAGFPEKWLHKSCDFISTAGWVDIATYQQN
jgi:glyoxylase-like metal-dependent hydrolase (beta-lactamase superfamily II)